jgi:hypothetical protein
MQRIALPPVCDLGGLAETIGTLDSLLPRISCPLPNQFICRGEIGTPGHFFYGPRFPLRAGRYLIWFWLRVRGDARSPHLVFEAVAWHGDSALSLGRHITALSRGAARTVIYPLWIEVSNPEQVELRAWSDGNSGNFRALGVDVHQVGASPPTPARSGTFRLPWRRPRTEAFANAHADFVELWLAFDPHRREAAQFALSKNQQPAAIIEVPDPAETAPFALADGRLLLSLRVPTESAAGYQATVSMGGRIIDLGGIEIPKLRKSEPIGHVAGPIRRRVPQLDADLASLEEPSPRSIEVIARKGRHVTANESEVRIVDWWLDFPLAPAARDQVVIDGRFVWDASGLRLRRGFARFMAGRFPALRLGCGPSGGRCTIRYRNRDIELDLYAAEPGFLLVFPTLAEAVLRPEPHPTADDAIHPAFEHMFRRLRASWADSAGDQGDARDPRGTGQVRSGSDE